MLRAACGGRYREELSAHLNTCTSKKTWPQVLGAKTMSDSDHGAGAKGIVRRGSTVEAVAGPELPRVEMQAIGAL